jgi:triosephosphate isomerase
MRRPVIAGNWKMNTSIAEAVALARAVAKSTAGQSGVTRIVCPPFVSLQPVASAIAGTGLDVGAQNLHHEEKGAFTGEISASMLVGLVSHVIVGHSERRTMFCETDASVALKALAAVRAGISPIVCVGETLDARKQGRAVDTVRSQVRASLEGFTDWDRLVLAYEPLWAIGTGEAASPMQAQEMAAAIRAELSQLAADAAEAVPILYGGSVNGENIGPFIDRDDIDGALVGGASLKADEFSKIIRLTASVSGV